MLTVDPAISTLELKPEIGTVVEADAATLLSGTAVDDIRALLGERTVLVFPDLGFDDQRQIAFTQTLGVQAFENNGVPQANGKKQAIFKVSLDSSVNPLGEYLKTSFYWHLDGSMHEVPTRALLLSARHLPPDGGATEWANTYAAYDALPAADKDALEGLRVVHANWVPPAVREPLAVVRDVCRGETGAGTGAAARVDAPLRAEVTRDRRDGGLCRRHGTG